MFLVYGDSGKEVKIGDVIQIKGQEMYVYYFKPSSEGLVKDTWISVIEEEWIEREDRV